MTSIEDNWPYEKVRPRNGAAYDILQTIETEYDRIDVEADELLEQRFIESATGRELEKLAREVGVIRQTGESDERFRFRTLIAKAVTRSSRDITEFAQLLELLFGDLVSTVSLSGADDKPVVIMTVSDIIIDTIPVTKEVLEDLLSQVLPSSDSLEIVLDDTFAFAGETNAGGFNEGVWG